MTFEAIIKELKQGVYQPIYLLHGAESYYIEEVSNYIEKNALSDAEKGFNQTIMYGKDTDPIQLLDVLRRYPMMAERQVVILKEAQKTRGLEKLMGYFEKPLTSTIFVIAHKEKTLAKNTKVYKQLAKKGVVLESKKLYDNQVPGFIATAAKAKKLAIDQKSTVLLAEFLGSDLSKINNELNKLSLNLPEGSKVTPAIIEQYIGVSKDYNIFELNRAICERNKEKAFRIVKYFIANPKANPPVLIMGGLYSFFSKVYPFMFLKNRNDSDLMSTLKTYPMAIKDMRLFGNNYTLSQTENLIHTIAEYDLKVKGVNDNSSNKSELFIEMVYKIMG